MTNTSLLRKSVIYGQKSFITLAPDPGRDQTDLFWTSKEIWLCWAIQNTSVSSQLPKGPNKLECLSLTSLCAQGLML